MGTELKDLAISYWRLEKWVANAPVDKKLAATSSLRNIKNYLDDNRVSIVDPVGQPYDVGMAVDVVRNNMDESDDIEPIISETVKPIVMQNDSVIMFGQVIIGKEVKSAPTVKSTAEVGEADQSDSPEIPSVDLDDSSKEPFKNSKLIKVMVALLVLCLCISCGSFAVQMFSLNKAQQTTTEEQTSIESYDDTYLLEQISELMSEVKTLKNTNPSDGVQFVRHTIAEGETLASICQKYGLNYYEIKNELLNLNKISDENKIYVGQVIYLPKI